MANGKKEPEVSKKEEKQEEEKKEPQNSEKELSEVKDRLLRLASEFDNYKKRSAKDVDAAKSLGKAELIKQLLPTLDEFELALCALNGSESDKSHAKGVELVFSNVVGTLKSAGLKEVEAKGKYDPYRHEIVMAKESKEPEGMILEVVRKGYTLNDALLRPSAVIVSKGNVSKQEVKGE
jgi:molecular chaperone GrpE